jgi:hypothetical protein
MKQTLLLISVLSLGLMLAPSASARVVEIGDVGNDVNPSCPADPCEAAVRVTALQGRIAGGRTNPYYIRRDGYIVAFTVQLSRPTDEQIAFFNDNFGTPAQVRLSVLRQGRTRKTRLNYRLISQTAVYEPHVRARAAAARQEDELDRDHRAHLGADLLEQPDRFRLVALVAREGQLRAAQEPRAVRLADSSGRVRLRVHVPRREAALHRHLHPRSAAHGRDGRGRLEVGG